jgi:site-specific recombinase XerD
MNNQPLNRASQVPNRPPYQHPKGYWVRNWPPGSNRKKTYGSDRAAAFAQCLREEAELTLGIRSSEPVAGMTVGRACDLYLAAQNRKRLDGKLKAKTLLESQRHLQTFTTALGRGTRFDLLVPADFDRVLDTIPLKKRRTREKLIVQVRALTKWLLAKRHLTVPPFWSDRFRQDSKSDARKHRAERQATRGSRVPTVDDIRKLFAVMYRPRHRALLLLAINGGLGAGDLAALRLNHWVRTQHALDFPRPKTGIRRIIPLWAETEAAIEEYLASNDRKKSLEAAPLELHDHIFLSREGHLISRDEIRYNDRNQPIAVMRISGPDTILARLQAKARVKGWSFYGLRALARQLWLGVPSSDPTLVRVLMGRAFQDSNDDFYLRALSHDLLRPFVEHAKQLLFASEPIPRGSPPDWAQFGQASGAERRRVAASRARRAARKQGKPRRPSAE